MRILTSATRLDGIGGLERAQLEMCRQLSLRGHHIDLLYTETGNLQGGWSRVAERRIRVRGYAFWRGAPLASAWDVLRVRVAVHRLAPDAIYLHHHRQAPALAAAGRPAVCHLHLPPPQRPSRQEETAMRRVDAFIAVSQFTADQWRERLGLDAERFTVVPNGVDPAAYAPAGETQRRRLRTALGLPGDGFLVVYAGRIDPEKGVDCALEAVRRIAADDLHLALVGEPNPGSFGGDAAAARAYGEQLRARYADVGAAWLGRLPDASPALAAADLVVVPSRFADPNPLIVLETLASGTPVVASAVGGIPEVLGEQFPDSLVPAGDVTALAERINALRDWRAVMPDLGAAGRRLVQQRYTVSRMGDGITAAIEAVAADSGSPT